MTMAYKIVMITNWMIPPNASYFPFPYVCSLSTGSELFTTIRLRINNMMMSETESRQSARIVRLLVKMASMSLIASKVRVYAMAKLAILAFPELMHFAYDKYL